MQKVPTNQTPTAPTTWFAGLCTTNPLDDGSGVTVGGTEPSSTGSYARQTVAWTTLTAYTSVTNDTASIASNSGALTWTSTAAFSTGATALSHILLNTSSTLATVAETSYLGRAAITVPQAVNAAGITLTCAIGALQMGCISA